ncbi:MAG: acetylserotonin O-methyltransferase [Acidobacteriota bacterium]|nr:acetylserotonin O-methyltransferase [Acidobacteriota bacterium]
MSNTNSNSAAAALPPHAQIVQMASAHVIAKGIYAVAELGIADHLKDGARTADELAQAIGAHADSLHRLMRSMAGFGLFVEDAERRFSLTPLGAALQSDAPGYARSAVRMLAGPWMWQATGELIHSAKTGETGMEKAFGRGVFEHLGDAPEQATIFNEAMIGFHGLEPPAVAAAYDFSGIEKLVDVGGGTGNLLTTILQANPELKGLLYDLPHVAGEARQQIETKGLSARCEVAEGSFFESVPSGGDAYLMSHIIHDWDEQKCVQILENCRKAMNGRGKLLLVEMVIPQGNDFHPSKLLDMVMLSVTGGKERTAEEYAALFEKAGFRLTRIVPTESPVSVIEAVPV